jgi:hypothetical protein
MKQLENGSVTGVVGLTRQLSVQSQAGSTTESIDFPVLDVSQSGTCSFKNNLH